MKLLRYILVILAATILVFMLWREFFGTSPHVSEIISDRVAEQSQNDPVAISLLGTPLYAHEPIGESGERMRVQLAEAITQHEADPEAVDGFVWLGRRLAYLARYTEAIEVYSQGLDLHKDEPHLLRHRGHRNITLRKLDDAILDFSRAVAAVAGQPDEVEPDGQPNDAGIPTSTLQTNIWYHYALAHYLRGEFETAAELFQNCLDLAKNDDMRVAAADWLYMSLRRAGMVDEADAAISFVAEEMDILENHAYHTRLLMYRGLITEDSFEQQLTEDEAGLTRATLGYGFGNLSLMNGDTLAAFEVYQQVLDTEIWATFGFIAAEADLARLRRE